MNRPLSLQRLAENEVIFRNHNEAVQKGLDEVKKIAVEEGQQYLVKKVEEPLHFYCECADENCRKRIRIILKEYKKLHDNRSRFIVIPGHNVLGLEKIVRRKAEYWVVEKFIKPPKTAKKLNATLINNS